MKEKEKTWYRRFFTIILTCESCENNQILKSGYDDANYYTNALPQIKCQKCFKSTSDINMTTSNVAKKLEGL